MSNLGFNQRNQKDGERIDNFVSELKRLPLTCEFSDLGDSLIPDRIAEEFCQTNCEVNC